MVTPSLRIVTSTKDGDKVPTKPKACASTAERTTVTMTTKTTKTTVTTRTTKRTAPPGKTLPPRTWTARKTTKTPWDGKMCIPNKVRDYELLPV